MASVVVAGLPLAVCAAPAVPVFLGDNNTTTSWQEIWDVHEGQNNAFFTTQGVYGDGIYSTDGTLEGTEHFLELIPSMTPLYVHDMTEYGGDVYLEVSASGSYELWKTDGTYEGTVQLTPSNTIEVEGVVAGGNGVYFNARDMTTGNYRLYKVDDASGGIIDLGPSYYYDPVALGGLVYFVNEEALWRTDGTEAGTFELHPEFEYGSLAEVNGTVFFAADQGDSVYATDGTAENVQGVLPMVEQNVASMAVLGDKMAIILEDDPEIYLSDGTAAGTQMVLDLNAMFGVYDVIDMVSLGDKVAFTVEYVMGSKEVYVSDGTVAGTVLLQALPAYSDGYLYAADNRVFFTSVADDGNVVVFWVSDGTPAGTQQVVQRPMSSGFDLEGAFKAGDRTLLLTYGNGVTQLLSYDPVSGVVLDIQPPGAHSDFVMFGPEVLGDNILFFGFEGETGLEPWVSDGTPAGTEILEDVWPGPEYETRAWVRSIYPASNKAFFLGYDPENPGSVIFPMFDIFVTDGTPGAATPLSVDILGFGDMATGVINDVFYFTRFAFVSSSLWRSDGTPVGTYDTGVQTTWQMIGLGDVVIAFTPSGVVAYDPADESSTMLRAGGSLVAPEAWTVVGDTAYIQLLDNTTLDSSVILETDGAPEGTRIVYEGGAEVVRLVNQHVNGKPLVITYDSMSDKMRLNVIDSEADPALELLASFDSAPQTFNHSFMLGEREHRGAFAKLDDGRLVFAGETDTEGMELWVTDGTAAGTSILVDINPGPGGSDPMHFTAAEGLVYFAANDGVHGSELWQSDGTVAGTVMVADIHAGAEGSMPPRYWLNADADPERRNSAARVFAYREGQLLFSADDGTGFDPWLIGSPNQGPEKVEMKSDEIEAGVSFTGTNPRNMVVAGERVFFSAETPATGTDLWVMPLGRPAAVSDWELY